MLTATDTRKLQTMPISKKSVQKVYHVPNLSKMTQIEIDLIVDDAIKQTKQNTTHTTEEVRQILGAEFGL